MTDSRSARRRGIVLAVIAISVTLLLGAVGSLFLNGRSDSSERDAAAYVRRAGGSVVMAAQTQSLPFLNIRLSGDLVVTQVSIPVGRLDDEMIAQLLKFHRLESIVLLGRGLNISGSARALDLSELHTAASPEAVARLQEVFPGLSVYGIPQSDFEATSGDDGASPR